jgi:hypothetical protein
MEVAMRMRLRRIGSLPVKVTVPPPSDGFCPRSFMKTANAWLMSKSAAGVAVA